MTTTRPPCIDCGSEVTSKRSNAKRCNPCIYKREEKTIKRLSRFRFERPDADSWIAQVGEGLWLFRPANKGPMTTTANKSEAARFDKFHQAMSAITRWSGDKIVKGGPVPADEQKGSA